jgi:prepilin peptidase CpaA
METFSTILNQVSISAFAALVLMAALSDFRRYLIPNGHVLGILLLYPMYVVTAPHPVEWLAASGIAAGVLTVGFILFALKRIGGGDVKLLTAAALWAGPAYALDFLLITGLAGGLISFALLLRLNYGWVIGWPVVNASRAVPYGVAIAAGGLFLAARLLMHTN